MDGHYKDCIEKDKHLEAANNLIQSMTKALDNARAAVKVLNTKVQEQEVTIMRLNNGIMKMVQAEKGRNMVLHR